LQQLLFLVQQRLQLWMLMLQQLCQLKRPASGQQCAGQVAEKLRQTDKQQQQRQQQPSP
jgi:hypothetical protein